MYADRGKSIADVGVDSFDIGSVKETHASHYQRPGLLFKRDPVLATAVVDTGRFARLAVLAVVLYTKTTSEPIPAAQAACLIVCIVEVTRAEQERDDRDKPAAGHER